MPLRRKVPVTWRPAGVSDSLDGSNSFRGAMGALQNLIPAYDTAGMFVPRPASIQLFDFTAFSTPGFISASLIIGDTMYGMISSALNSGHDQPFAYDLSKSIATPPYYYTVAGITSANTPPSPATSGDWVPPTMCQVGSRIVVTHPGFNTGGYVGAIKFKYGWFDVSGFSDAAHTGNTNTSTTVNALSANVLQAGWQPGMTISSNAGDIPAGASIVSIASNGLSLVMSVAATASTAGVTLTVEGGQLDEPLWGAGDTNLNNLPSVPLAVAQMGGRAYFACGVNGIPFTDSLNASQRTNASQALATNDGLAVTCFGALGLASPVSGGVVQSLIAFQGAAKMQQITGDTATSNLAMNALTVATGTLAPLTVTPAGGGLIFLSPDGVKIIDPSANVSPPIGQDGQGIQKPFIFINTPSRSAAAFGSNIYRISFSTTYYSGQIVARLEYWYDLGRQIWTGPHTFPANQIQPWPTQNTFVLAPTGTTALLFQSDPKATSASTYTENGAAMQSVYQTVLLPDNDLIAMNSMIETDIMLSLPALGTPAKAHWLDDSGYEIDRVSVPTTPSNRPQQVAIPWVKPLTFKQGSFRIDVNSAAGMAFGDLYLGYQVLGYKLQASLTLTYVTLTGSGNWTVPAGVTVLQVIECIGEGGNGYQNGTARQQGAGGGGGYSTQSNVAVAPGQVIPYVCGTGGTGTDTNFNSSAIIAKAGANGTNAAGGAGGAVNGSYGQLGYAGAAGGAAVIIAPPPLTPGSGGGGAAGRYGPGLPSAYAVGTG
ncbi:MAG: hypothetical protein D4R58_01895, partial [Betaproteobacteria bacterium]